MNMTATMTETGELVETGQVPMELVALKGRIADQPPKVRAELEPLIDEVLEHAMFRSRVMLIARDALQLPAGRHGGAEIRSGSNAARTRAAIVLIDRSRGVASALLIDHPRHRSSPALWLPLLPLRRGAAPAGYAASQPVTTRPTSSRLAAEQFFGTSSAVCQYRYSKSMMSIVGMPRSLRGMWSSVTSGPRRF